MAADPNVSVVVPARDAEATIGATLAALAAQDFAGEWEVVVVDDGSSDATPALAEEAGRRVVRTGGGAGPAGARNAGVAATTAPIVAFTDADCEPVPGWLTALVAGFAEADLVRGPIRPDPKAPRRPFDRTLDVPGPSPLFETANLAVRRELLARVGGFEAFAPDPARPRPGLRPRVDQGHFGEDAVLGWKVVRAGGRAGFAPEAVVHHAVFPRGAMAAIAERRRRRFFPALVREIPELRATMPLGVFLSRRTVRFDAAVAGVALAVATRRPAPLLLAVPYARRDLRRHAPWRRSGWRENAAYVAGDAVGLAALVRGSVAARRAVL
jgi:glycosyltransferase involved in cell wall biosynthesis